MEYCIWRVSPNGYQHSEAFSEVVLSLASAFKELGYNAPVVKSFEAIPANHTPVVIGANLIRVPVILYNAPHIIWNLEQVTKDSPWMTAGYLDLLRHATVWDYSLQNTEALRHEGISALHLPVGYASELTRIKKYTVEGPPTDLDIHPEKIRFRQQITEVSEDIDCSFSGSLNERRQRIIDGLNKAGVNVVARFGIYGQRRDDIIARSKVCLNMHFYPSKTFEIVRCSYLLANHKCVVSEVGNDPMEEDFRKAVSFVPYDDIIERCLFFIHNDEERRRQERHGFEIFSGMRQVGYLRKVLE